MISLITVRNEVAKAMFLHLSVILSTGGGGVWLSACWVTVSPPGAATPPPSPGSRHLPEEGTPTPADGTHPTGMHSCYRYTLTTVDLLNIIKSRFKNDNCRLLTANAAVDVRSLGMCQICIS